MAAFQDKEQILMAYYVQYYRGAAIGEVKELDRRLREEIGEEKYGQAMDELAEQGLVLGIEGVEEREKEGLEAPMATREGILYISEALSLQSDMAEETILYYFDKYLQASEENGLELTLEPVKAYIDESIKEHQKEKPNSNQP
ncbi:hypothetical protein [Planomicrobium sp. CPCC 101110]|uniref:hypothetical protein n=1 Tax=Planomicrobium sp. CPCC 101110 TaxID=2599619 RepID=UPI0011B3C3FE|nr:hypothetical protein [Planomicrobium sp. CPCC 101110]TWT24704.1 hypothetical protein FQV30_14485 [Planomicrobium sp. CPCC 101110]